MLSKKDTPSVLIVFWVWESNGVQVAMKTPAISLSALTLCHSYNPQTQGLPSTEHLQVSGGQIVFHGLHFTVVHFRLWLFP